MATQVFECSHVVLFPAAIEYSRGTGPGGGGICQFYNCKDVISTRRYDLTIWLTLNMTEVVHLTSVTTVIG